MKRGSSMSEFIENVKKVSRQKRNSIILIPDDCVVDKKHLGILLSHEFVSLFRELQHLIMSMYDDIEKDPIAWGFPEEPTTKDLDYHRLTETLFALMTNGEYSDNTVMTDTSAFLKAIKSFSSCLYTIPIMAFSSCDFSFQS
jgi:hypothetical protein